MCKTPCLLVSTRSRACLYYTQDSSGCDVSHPAPGVYDRPSVASLVASADRSATRYKVFARAQRPREELITDIAEMLLVRDVYSRRATPFLPAAFRKQSTFTCIFAGIYREVLSCSVTAYLRVNMRKSSKKKSHQSKVSIIFMARSHARLKACHSNARKTL